MLVRIGISLIAIGVIVGVVMGLLPKSVCKDQGLAHNVLFKKPSHVLDVGISCTKD